MNKQIQGLVLPLVFTVLLGLASFVAFTNPASARPTQQQVTSQKPLPVVQPSGVSAIPVPQNVAAAARASGKPAIQIQDVNAYVNSQSEFFRGQLDGKIQIASTQLVSVSQASIMIHGHLSLPTDRPYYLVLLNNQLTFYGSSPAQVVHTKHAFEMFDAYTGNIMVSGGM